MPKKTGSAQRESTEHTDYVTARTQVMEVYDILREIPWVEPAQIKKIANDLLLGFNEYQDEVLSAFWDFMSYLDDKCLQVRFVWGAHLVVKPRNSSVPTAWALFEARLRMFLDAFHESWGEDGRITYKRDGDEFRIWIPWLARNAQLAGRGIKQLVEQFEGAASQRAGSGPWAETPWPISLKWDGALEMEIEPAAGEFIEVVREELSSVFPPGVKWVLEKRTETSIILRMWGFSGVAVDALQILAHEGSTGQFKEDSDASS